MEAVRENWAPRTTLTIITRSSPRGGWQLAELVGSLARTIPFIGPGTVRLTSHGGKMGFTGGLLIICLLGRLELLRPRRHSWGRAMRVGAVVSWKTA